MLFLTAERIILKKEENPMKKPLREKGSRKKDIDKGKRFCEKPLHGQESEKPYKAEKGIW